MSLEIVPDVPFACCMPWGARHALFVCQGNDEPLHGATCCFCDRDVAAPEAARGKRVACIYCGMDRGFHPAVDEPPFAGSPG